MPEREFVLGAGRGKLVGVGAEEGVEGAGQQAAREPGDGEQDDRRDEPPRGAGPRPVRTGRGTGRGTGRAAAERAVQEAGPVGDGQRGARHDPGEDGGVGAAVRERLEGGLLRDESEERRQPDHGRDREGRRDGEDGPPPSRAGQFVGVPRALLVFQDADREEQRRLEQAVREQQRDARERGRPGPGAEQHHEEAELADGAVGEQPFQVVLAERDDAAAEQADEPDGDDQRTPRAGSGERGRQPRHQVDARLDHRGGVQVAADGRRRDHRGGQPRVQRHLGGLGERAEQDQHHRGHGRGAAGRVGDDLGDPVRPGGLPEHDEPGQHDQAERGGGQQGLQGGAPVRGPLGVPGADEDEGADRGQLPEHVEDEQVVGEDEPGHRARERDERPDGEPLGAGTGREVPRGVAQDDRADAADEQQHHHGEGVQPEVDRQAEFGRPRQPRRVGVPGRDVPGAGDGPGGGGGRDERGGVPHRAAVPSERPGDEDRSGGVKQDQGEHDAAPGTHPLRCRSPVLTTIYPTCGRETERPYSAAGTGRIGPGRPSGPGVRTRPSVDGEVARGDDRPTTEPAVRIRLSGRRGSDFLLLRSPEIPFARWRRPCTVTRNSPGMRPKKI
ncbi:hypothetical protein BJF79_14695 [Actinomadura sp. CNU-125]|nr:hypothetical protein [Actinomadura sp. CNU-125]OLT23379.1 hypothetical protein BJF79_14695 [Actinomadura sp. CNU-125]